MTNKLILKNIVCPVCGDKLYFEKNIIPFNKKITILCRFCFHYITVKGEIKVYGLHKFLKI